MDLLLVSAVDNGLIVNKRSSLIQSKDITRPWEMDLKKKSSLECFHRPWESQSESTTPLHTKTRTVMPQKSSVTAHSDSGYSSESSDESSPAVNHKSCNSTRFNRTPFSEETQRKDSNIYTRKFHSRHKQRKDRTTKNPTKPYASSSKTCRSHSPTISPTVLTIQNWLLIHGPNPSQLQAEYLSLHTGLSVNQVKRWLLAYSKQSE